MLPNVMESERAAEPEVVSALAQLTSLRMAGVLSQSEFQAAKARLLHHHPHHDIPPRPHRLRNALLVLLALAVLLVGLATVAKLQQWWIFAPRTVTPTTVMATTIWGEVMKSSGFSPSCPVLVA